MGKDEWILMAQFIAMLAVIAVAVVGAGILIALTI